jgi:catechol 2,3-dioxygenase-like lactoylglutathione lyase family enzyme
MLDHLGLEVADFDRSRTFYEHALEPLGISVLMEPAPGVAGFGEQHDQKPYFWIATRSGKPQTGVHVAFAADTRDLVDAFHAAALEAGATDNGEPGVRELYHPNYYGAYVLDPDGNNVEACCHYPA